MAWLKLTKTGLYLMKSGSSCYVKKVDVSSSNQNLSELRLSVPLDWFSGRDIPGSMVIDLESDEPETCRISATPSGPIETPLSGKVIILDPGQGELQGGINDPGAVNGVLGRNERDEVRKQADIIKARLEKKGTVVKVVENNTDKSLTEIGSEGRGSDCFVSLHLTAFNRKVQGHQVFIHTQGTPTDEKLATLINQELAKVLPIKDAGVKRMGLGVLRGVPFPVPAVLTESFFIDSVQDTVTLDSWNELAANAIAEGIEQCFAT
ncbi:N-acetylmuramoyl-L-alanine amidase [filamentous cyanobacterium LEGE 11480]|uniref:N-acetylmuramoyl-L-alanine amidase n=1 Tax=Romeriopsis navalis LEGE 11480 TaxID=2777977 RepID=A0A928Z3L6_9CYAN|nr:N-acetylmuramoyl-L-alanine amidase [Romeriopsis navalis]MBE9030152.1 N-acetylmuramoyl-L-alanine amidase [Romeriopsis navalis LEGE 11480]